MAQLFAQSITQFAPLRTFARIHTTTLYSQLIRELFPKARFDEQKTSCKIFMKIAWSFLSIGITINDMKRWCIDRMKHRFGGLPAMICADGSHYWYKNGACHRDDKDSRTGLTLPAMIYQSNTREWYKDGERHRDDKDPRTGLTLPAHIGAFGNSWYKNGYWHREDKDPQTGLTLPAVIWKDGSRAWFKGGLFHRDDKDL